MNLDELTAQLRAIRDDMNECIAVLERRERERLREQMKCMDESEAERAARLRFGYQKPYSED